MKAAVVPAVSRSWQIKDVPQPQLGPGQVLVKMHASGICYTGCSPNAWAPSRTISSNPWPRAGGGDRRRRS